MSPVAPSSVVYTVFLGVISFGIQINDSERVPLLHEPFHEACFREMKPGLDSKEQFYSSIVKNLESFADVEQARNIPLLLF